MNPLERIAERVNRLGDPNDPSTPRPLVSIDEFFSRNTERCNLSEVPSPEEFHTIFLAFSQRPDVKDIRVQITMFDDPEWPFSDTVYIMTTASAEEVAAWFPAELRPDETWSNFLDQVYEPYTVPAGVHPIDCWGVSRTNQPLPAGGLTRR